jgi:predicted outer membrane repeat protein
MFSVNRMFSLFRLNSAVSLGAVLIAHMVPAVAQAAANDRPGSQGGDVILGTPLRVGVGTGCTHPTIQAAVNSVGAGSSAEIRVNSGTYSEAVSIINKSIQLIGGYTSCMASSPESTTTIQALSGTRPLTVATGSSGTRSVTISNFNLTNGSVTALDSGGGVWATASGTATLVLEMHNAQITGNSSLSGGGGLHMETFAAGSTVLALLTEELVISNNNAATRGGGIWCSGPGTGEITIRGGRIRQNVAGTPADSDGEGGGIALDGCALTWFSGPSGGALTTGLLGNNTSHGKGGGIWAVNGASVLLNGYYVTGLPATTISDQPLWVFQNLALGSMANPAGGQGGGVWLSNASLTASAAWIDRNSTTGNGGGIYAINGSQVQINRNIDDPFGGTATCHSEIVCSQVARNQATDTGGAIYTRDAGTFAVIEQTVIRDNATQAGTGATLFAQTDSHLRTISSLIFGGNAQGSNPNYVFWVGTNANVDVFWTTVADNLPGNAIFRFGASSSELTLRGSIIHEPGTNIGFTGGATPSVDSDCVVWHSDMLTNPPYNFTGSPIFHLVADPEFANREAFAFDLQPSSPAVDFCDSSLPPGTAPTTDLVLNSRGLLANDGPAFRPYDLGAFEFIPDQIFRDRFE